ncbi:acyltransferase family protein [Saccharolobus shibatae]|uniref:O-antigen acetylase (ACLAME 476) n=1 Tax=Saccharolobus shibatae TaxID=2286 RepID=A0A8F5GWC9_9CREN|nr:acyltransferase [Saccharolobus shibatae]QXJ31876.1 O-antigen acetylase (ACLAME 476) [Saccharolobus shibatae]
MKYDPRIAQLRFYASFSVALYHLWTLQIIALPLFRPGWLGVPLFFELSIYLLLNRLDDNPSLLHYFKRRVKRIWPLYFLAVIVVFLTDKYTFHIDVSYYDLLLHFVFVSFVVKPFSFNYLFWSLQLEEWMYLFIPIIHRLSEKGKFYVATGLIVTTVVYSYFAVSQPYPVFHLLFFLPPFWLGAYGWGIIAYLTKEKNNHNIYYIILGVLITSYIFTALTIKEEVVYEFLTHFLIYNFMLPVFAMLINNPPKVLKKITALLGEVSYGIYLWTLLFQELYGLFGIPIGVAVAFLTEFPLRWKEILRRIFIF